MDADAPHYYCFISYTRREPELYSLKRFVDWYIDELRARGWISRVNTRSIIFYDYLCTGRVHSDLELRIFLETALGESDFMTAFLSPAYFASDWCRFEWDIMTGIEQNSGNKILPLVWKCIDRVPMWHDARWRFWIKAVDRNGLYPVDEGCNWAEAINTCVRATGNFFYNRALYLNGK